jgi:hypothetical protein
MIIDYIMVPFVLLDFGRSWEYWKSVGFWGHIVLGVISFHFLVLGPAFARLHHVGETVELQTGSKHK